MATRTGSDNTLCPDPTSADVAIGGSDSDADFWFDAGSFVRFKRELRATAHMSDPDEKRRR